MSEEQVNQLKAHLARGDSYDGAGDERAASSFYVAALKLANSLPRQFLDADLISRLQNAQKRCQDYARNYERFLYDRLEAASPLENGSRLSMAMDLLTGRRKIYHQQPTTFYFPELPQRQFFGREEFGWVAPLEAHTSSIKREAEAVLARSEAFQPYLSADPDRAHNEHHEMVDNDDWGAFYLWKDGILIEENAAQCPATMEAISAVPLCKVDGRLPSVLFSLLRPGAHIPPHTGLVNTRLICHLPLIVPDGCSFRVGNETRNWREGETLIFDDTIEHEARNTGSEPRIVLLFDIWRPELSDIERRQVAAILSAITQYHAGETSPGL